MHPVSSRGSALFSRLLLALWPCLLVGCGAADGYFAAAREQMVRRQLSAPGRDITNARVLAVMRKVPRHEFVPVDLRGQAYNDHPLPIGYDQTISQPFIVA